MLLPWDVLESMLGYWGASWLGLTCSRLYALLDVGKHACASTFKSNGVKVRASRLPNGAFHGRTTLNPPGRNQIDVCYVRGSILGATHYYRDRYMIEFLINGTLYRWVNNRAYYSRYRSDDYLTLARSNKITPEQFPRFALDHGLRGDRTTLTLRGVYCPELPHTEQEKKAAPWV